MKGVIERFAQFPPRKGLPDYSSDVTHLCNGCFEPSGSPQFDWCRECIDASIDATCVSQNCAVTDYRIFPLVGGAANPEYDAYIADTRFICNNCHNNARCFNCSQVPASDGDLYYCEGELCAGDKGYGAACCRACLGYTPDSYYCDNCAQQMKGTEEEREAAFIAETWLRKVALKAALVETQKRIDAETAALKVQEMSNDVLNKHLLGRQAEWVRIIQNDLLGVNAENVLKEALAVIERTKSKLVNTHIARDKIARLRQKLEQLERERGENAQKLSAVAQNVFKRRRTQVTDEE